jgi:hypothetical protein
VPKHVALDRKLLLLETVLWYPDWPFSQQFFALSKLIHVYYLDQADFCLSKRFVTNRPSINPTWSRYSEFRAAIHTEGYILTVFSLTTRKWSLRARSSAEIFGWDIRQTQKSVKDQIRWRKWIGGTSTPPLLVIPNACFSTLWWRHPTIRRDGAHKTGGQVPK